MASLWRINEAVASIEAGGVIACPAEAVWGLSCDPWNLSAVAFLCEMKQRALSKGVIVASGDVAHFGPSGNEPPSFCPFCDTLGPLQCSMAAGIWDCSRK